MNSNPMYMEYVDDTDPGPVRRRGWRILGWVSIGLSVIMVGTSLTAYGFYWKLQNNIKHEDADSLINTKRPKKLNNALNILMLGTDSRDGANAKYGRRLKDDPPRSDTMILLHLSPGGGQAMGISFPRDLMVPIPTCTRKNGSKWPASGVAQINESFTRGGAACTIATIEGISDVKIDHFMQVDFTSFKAVTNAVGGVEVCLPKAVDDKQSKLHLSKGKHVIKGETALAYVRNRHGLGDGSDLSRVKRQQQFMGSLAKKVLSAGTLTNPGRLLSLAQAGTKSLTTDNKLNLSNMMKIAQGMSGLSAGKLRFVTVPNGPYVADINRVQLRQPAANDLFTQLRNDKDVPETPKASQASSKVPPNQVRVRVLNASGVTGQAGRVAEALRAQGFQIVKIGDLRGNRGTAVMYGSGGDQQAATLASVIPNTKPTARSTGGLPGVVDLVLGSDFTQVKNKSGSGIGTQQGEIRATDNICKET